MADSDKNIIITPSRGLTTQPEIYFGGSGGVPIRLKVLDDSNGTLSFEGSAGQLFSINNNLTSGSIFSVNDVSGIPSIDVNANGTVSIAGYTGNVGIGITAPTAKFHVTGGVALFGSGVTFSSTTDHAGVARFAAGVTTSTLDVTGTSRFAGTITSSVANGISGNRAILQNIQGNGSTYTTIETPSSGLQTEGGLRFLSSGLPNRYNTLTTVSLSADRTISMPDETGTIALRGANTFTGLQTLTAGLSAGGGITFNGTITGATATLNRLLTISAGLSAAGGVTFNDIINPVRGVVNGYPRIEWAGLTSTFDILPTHWANISAPIGTSPTANDAYFAPIFITRRVQIKTIGTQTGTNGASNTGNILLGLYDSDSSGFPRDRLYTSASIALSTGSFAVQRATSVDTIVNPGQYWLAIVFSAASIPVAGLGRVGTIVKWITPTSSSPIAQASVDGLRRAQGSFTLATSQSGTFTTVAGSDNPALFYTAETV